MPSHTSDEIHTKGEDDFHTEAEVGEEVLSVDQDGQDMNRVGKVQELKRNFSFLSMWGFAMVTGCSWEFVLVGCIISLPNGGPGGAIWMYLIVACLMFCTVLSMAEMASMAPTAGAQYHWVSEFAPRKYQKFLSFTVGWLVAIAWQSGLAAGAFSVALQLEAIIVLANPNYVMQGWHASLLTIGCVVFGVCMNLSLRKLPYMEGLAMTLHLFGFFAFFVVLWVMGPRGDAKTVFTSFEDNFGWGSLALAAFVGWLSPIGSQICGDSACHLSEELRNASSVLPRSMIMTALVNYTLGFAMTITVMFTVGNAQDVIASATGQPYVQVILNATGSRGATIVLTAVVAFLILFSTTNAITTSSRQIYAFARDEGLPFSAHLSKVRGIIPLTAVFATVVCTVLLSLIPIGSTIAFTIVLSLNVIGLLSSYFVPIACVLALRIQGRLITREARFTLGDGIVGIVVNSLALMFLVIAIIFAFFPSAANPTPQSMNWTCLIFGTTLLFSWVYYFVYARHRYQGPVQTVTRELKTY